MSTVGFVGLGNMGAPMAQRLAEAGHALRVHDSADAARARFADTAGITVTPDVAAGADVVILMLPDSATVERVLLADGLLARVDPSTVVIDMSSSEPARTRALAERATAEHGVDLIDAPVSGGVSGARSGSLTVMVGGPRRVFDAVRPILDVLGSRVVHAGEQVGAGHAIKALNNLMSAAHLLVSAEALQAGRAFGLDPSVMLEIVNGSSGRSGSTETKWPRFILPETFDSGFGARLMLKDMRIALGLQDNAGTPAPVSRAAVDAWSAATDDLAADADHTEVAAWVRGRAEARSTLTEEQRRVKEEFIALRGTWSDAWQRILELDPAFLHAYLQWSAVPWRKNHLEPKVKELMYVAVDAAATHLYQPGIRQHIRRALDLGATAAEVMEVLELTSTLGIHACNIGVPLLLDVLEEEGLRTGPAALTPEQERMKAEFTANRGYWHQFWEGMLEVDPELFSAYVDFSSHPWRHGVLEPKVKEFVYIAFDAAATHLYVPGLKLHMRNAIRLGASADEILEVLEIASVIGIHTATVAAPILAEELDR